MTTEFTITLARMVTDMVPDGEPFQADLGQRPNLIPVQRAEALVWLLRGTVQDVKKAEKHCDEIADGWQVFTFDASEPDPIGAAKKRCQN